MTKQITSIWTWYTRFRLLLLVIWCLQTHTQYQEYIIVRKSITNTVIIVSVSYKKYHKTLGKRAKRHPFLYYYDEGGVFRSKRITRFEAFFRKFQKKKRFKFTCSTCNRSFKAINQKKSNIRCPYCDWDTMEIEALSIIGLVGLITLAIIRSGFAKQ